MNAKIEIRPTTYAEWYALEEERDQLRNELEQIKAEAEWLRSEAQFGTEEDRLDREAEAAALIEWDRHKRSSRGCTSVPADDIGYWERRIARRQGRDEAKTKIDKLRAELFLHRHAPVAVEVPELTEADVCEAIMKSRLYREIAANLTKVVRAKSSTIPPSRILKDEADRFDLGFVEACAILAAKPFDQPTLAAGIIKEGGCQDDLAGTTSDWPGIEILRRELGIDALRSKGGE